MSEANSTAETRPLTSADVGAGPEARPDSLDSFPELVASGAPTPGGGSVAAYSGVLAAALGQMMCNLTIGKKKYADAEPRLKEIKDQLERSGERLRELIGEDAASFEAVLKAFRLPKATEEQSSERARQIGLAGHMAISTPLETARRAVEVLRLLGELTQIGNPNALSDVTVGGLLSLTAVKGAYYNIGVNLSLLSDREQAETIRRQITDLIAEAEAGFKEIEARMLAQM